MESRPIEISQILSIHIFDVFFLYTLYRGYSFQHDIDENILLIDDYSTDMTTTCLKKSHSFI